MKTTNKFILSATLLIILITTLSFSIVLYKDRTYFHSPPYNRETTNTSDVLVIYYSRTGNTEAMAREIARIFDADIQQLITDKYPLTLKGLKTVNDDSASITLPVIHPETIDMKNYRLIFLGSPIWRYRPAPLFYPSLRRTTSQAKILFCLILLIANSVQNELTISREDRTNGRGINRPHLYKKRPCIPANGW